MEKYPTEGYTAYHVIYEESVAMQLLWLTRATHGISANKLIVTFGLRGRCETRTLCLKNQMQILNELSSCIVK